MPDTINGLNAELVPIFETLSHAERQTALIPILLHYTELDRMRALIRTACADDDLIAACAVNSERHPLGFDKFVLSASPLFEVRLHIWWPGAVSGRGDVHNHRFSYASAVIAGVIQVSSYRLGRSGVTMTRLAERRISSSVYKYRPVGDSHVKRMTTWALSSGSAYYMDATELHRVEMMGGQMAATLFIRTGDEHRNTTIMTARDPAEALKTERERLAADEVRKRLLRFVHNIS